MIFTRFARRTTTRIVLGTHNNNKELLCPKHIRLHNCGMPDSSRCHISRPQYLFFLPSTFRITKFPNAREPPFDILLFITILSLVNQSVYLSTVSRILLIQFITEYTHRAGPTYNMYLILSIIFASSLAPCASPQR